MKNFLLHFLVQLGARPPKPYSTIAGMLLAFLVLQPLPTSARRYQPPSGDPPDGSFGSNGSRGCENQTLLKSEAAPNQLLLTLLAPLTHVGRSTTSTPTLAWYMPAKDPYRVKISLFAVNPDQSSELLHGLEYVETTSGIVQYTLPEDKSELKVGQRYFVQLSLACKPNSDSFDQFFVAEIDVQAPPLTLTKALSVASTPKAKAELYTNAGYWFDAVRELLVEADRTQSYQALRDLLQDLAESEAKPHQQALIQIMEVLEDEQLATPK